jgi:penicillin V acylase-like amidase (Ntn superfamily)
MLCTYLPQLFVWRPTLPPAVEASDPEQDALAAATAQRRACLVPLGTVSAQERDTMDFVQRQAFALMQAQVLYLEKENTHLEGTNAKQLSSNALNKVFTPNILLCRHAVF